MKKISVVLMAFLISVLMWSVPSAAAKAASILVKDPQGKAIQGVPVLVNDSQVYITSKDGKVIIDAKGTPSIEVPSVFEDEFGTNYTFEKESKSLKEGETILFLATSSQATTANSPIEEELYKAVRQAASTQKPYVGYWVDTPLEDQSNLDSICEAAIEQVRREYPQYYLSNMTDVGYYCFDGTGQYNVIEYSLTYSITNESKKKEVSDKVAQIVGKAKGSDYDKLKFFHDTLVEICDYDLEAAESNSSNYPDAFNPYGALIKGRAVCEGYADAFKMLCDNAGIECYTVTGRMKELHAWNYVRLEGELYMIDCTGDDPVDGSPNHAYFLKGSDRTQGSHYPDASEPGKLSTSDYKNTMIKVRTDSPLS